MRSFTTILALLVVAAPLAAQSALVAAPSTRATTVLSLHSPRVQGQAPVAPLTVKVEYGQPHVRGRAVPVELTTDGTVWRTGANSATTLTSEVDLVIGGVAVPKGAYSLYTVRDGGKYLLILNRNTGQWGTEYDARRDLARVPLTARTMVEAIESLQIALVPPVDGPPKGVMTIAWGTLHLSAEWSVP